MNNEPIGLEALAQEIEEIPPAKRESYLEGVHQLCRSAKRPYTCRQVEQYQIYLKVEAFVRQARLNAKKVWFSAPLTSNVNDAHWYQQLRNPPKFSPETQAVIDQVLKPEPPKLIRACPVCKTSRGEMPDFCSQCGREMLPPAKWFNWYHVSPTLTEVVSDNGHWLVETDLNKSTVCATSVRRAPVPEEFDPRKAYAQPKHQQPSFAKVFCATVSIVGFIVALTMCGLRLMR